MAYNPSIIYTGNINAPSANYPYGSARNDSSASATDGTPLEERWLNDLLGWQAALLQKAGLTPSGDPETALVSQFLEALERTTAGTVQVSAFTKGATGDVTTLVQECEDYASANSLKVVFDVVCNITDPIIKKTNSLWIESVGGLQRLPSFTGNTFPLVICSNIELFTINNILLTNAIKDDYTQASSDIDDLNALIAIENCSRFKISQIRGTKFSQGIFYSGCNYFTITENNLDSGTTVNEADYENNNFTKLANVAGTGGIVSNQQLGVLTPASTFYSITNNQITCFNLDTGIDAVSNSFTRNPSVITGNSINGCICGIQIYQGALSDNGNALTYQRNVTVVANDISYCWDQGIYIRLSYGCIASGNIIRKTNMNGELVASGTPFGGIVCRISQVSQPPVSPNISADVGNLIYGNIVQDTGRDALGAMGAIHIRTEGTKAFGNLVVQSKERGYPKVGFGIYVSDQVHDFEIVDNRVSGFNQAVRVSNTQWGSKIGTIMRNYITDCNDGILGTDSFGQLKINENVLYNIPGIAINVRFAPKSGIRRNEIQFCGTGINIAGGCFESNLNGRSTQRVGPSLEVEFNSINETTIPHAITESSGTNEDAFFFSRCKLWRGDTVDGQEVSNRDSDGVPPTSLNRKSWNKADIFYNTNPQSGNVTLGSICIQEGTYGTIPVTTTARINSGENILTVNDSTGLAEGVYITIVGLTGIKKIFTLGKIPVETTGTINIGQNTLEVDTTAGLAIGANITIAGVSGVKQITNISGTTITLDSNADASVADAVVEYDVTTMLIDSNANASVTMADVQFSNPVFELLNVSGTQQEVYETESVTISSGSVTVTSQARIVDLIVDTEGAAASDDLENINASLQGQIIIVRSFDSARVINLVDGPPGNLRISSAFSLDFVGDRLMLSYTGTSCIEISRSSN